VTAARWAPARVARRLRQGGVDRLWAAGAQLNQLAVRLSAAGPQRYEAMQRIDAPGGPVHRRAAERFEALFGAPVLSCYAITEAGGPATRGATRAGADHRPFDVGGTRAGLDVDVIGADGARHLGDEPGDLHLRGAALGREAPPRRASGPVPGPVPGDGAAAEDHHGGGRSAAWPVPTGDWGHIDSEGHLHVIGRRRDRFECDGVAVWPQLVEEALAGHPLVADVAVAPRPDPDLGAFAVAVTVPTDPEHPPFLSDLEPVLADLPRAWRPKAQAIVESLPLTATGQVHRRMLAYDEAAR
jgi:acyl-CoA synthetase (AMP-forming)/AMP-acid ligase II